MEPIISKTLLYDKSFSKENLMFFKAGILHDAFKALRGSTCMHEHKRWISEVFDRASLGYGKDSSSFFTHFGKRLVQQLPVFAGAHVLDVATGRGAVLFPLAEAAGPSGRVVGVDISRQMLQETAKDVVQKKMDWIELLCMDAEDLDFPDNSFDFVFCGFALFFLPLLPIALAEFQRVLEPGGMLAVSIWGEDSELDAWMNEEMNKLSITTGLAATPLWKEKDLYRVLDEAFFEEIKVTEETYMFFHRNAEDWWKSLWNHGTRAKFEQLSSEQIDSFHKRAIEKAESLDKGEGIVEPLQVFYATAKKPQGELH